jgi:Holliday junction resolvase-like predicted endonuclease
MTYDSSVHRGKRWEESAARWFQERHPEARLSARNFRTRAGEIDLIFEAPYQAGQGKQGSVLIFIEVRARLGHFQSGWESVDWKKQRRLASTIQAYLVSYRGPATEIRIDILQWDGRRFSHFPNQWLER